jgi:hypothetical protein
MWLELSPTQKEKAVQTAQQPAPKALLSRTPREDWLVLTALWQDFREKVQTAQGQFPRPNSEFFRTLRLIHVASHDQALSDLEQAAMPYASIYLLNQYLAMRNLRPALNKAIHNGKGSLRWNPTTILHRMQVVINTFLGLHGWRADGALFVTASMSDWQDVTQRTFGVNVKIRKPSLLMAEDDLVVPTRAEIEQNERALAWALWALFAYSLDLGLGRVEFW